MEGGHHEVFGCVVVDWMYCLCGNRRVPGTVQRNLPPAAMLMHPGPGVDGPGPGVMTVSTRGTLAGHDFADCVRRTRRNEVTWDVAAPGAFDSEPLVCPGRYNFPQGAIYRLKLSNIPGRPGVELYPTLEVGPVDAQDRGVLGAQRHSGSIHPRGFRSGSDGQFRDQGDLSARSGVPGIGPGRRRNAGKHSAGSGRGPDRRSRSPRRHLGDRTVGNKDLQAPAASSRGRSCRGFLSMPRGRSGNPRHPMPMGMAVGGPSTMPMYHLSGVTGPQYGLPMCGTPIGLPGPPSVPMGVPAGLQKHVIKNHTHVHLPKPTEKVKVDVKQVPGISYPKPDDHVRIVERTQSGVGWFHQPLSDRHEKVKPNCENEGECPAE